MHGGMENAHVPGGLIRNWTETVVWLEDAWGRVFQLAIDSDKVDATIRLFAPDIDLAEIRPKPHPLFGYGLVFSTVSKEKARSEFILRRQCARMAYVLSRIFQPHNPGPPSSGTAGTGRHCVCA